MKSAGREVLGAVAGALVLVCISQSVVDVLAFYRVGDNALLRPDSAHWWAVVQDPAAVLGSTLYSPDPGASVSWSFTGSRVAYLYSTAYNRGAALVKIDGVVVDLLDAFTPDVRRQVGKVYNTPGGPHTITVVNHGGGANQRVIMDLDAFVSDIMAFGPGTYNEDAVWVENRVMYYPLGFFPAGSWSQIAEAHAYQGAYKLSPAARSGFRINFSGDSIVWWFPKRPDLGRLAVTLDGEDRGYFNPYADQTDHYGFSGLGAGVHILTVTNLGQTTSAGSVLALDRFTVGGLGEAYQRVAAAAYADGWAHSVDVSRFGYFPENDCVNFASQMQFQGGLAMHPAERDGEGLNAQDRSQWWNYTPTLGSASLTWRTVPDFLYYTQHRSEFMAVGNVASLQRGDVIFLDLWDEAANRPGHDGVYDHLKEVVGLGYISPYPLDYASGLDLSGTTAYGLLTDGHTNDRWHVPWDFNVDLNNNGYLLVRVAP